MVSSLRLSFPSPPLALLLPILCALFLPCTLGHCPTQCMEVAYLSGNYFKPFAAPLTNMTPLQGAARCAEACASRGTKYFSINPDRVCSCPNRCNPALHNHGEGFFGVTYQCFYAPSGFVSSFGCTATVAGTCPFACNGTALSSTCTKVGTNKRKCCCSPSLPNAVYYNGLKGCAGAINEAGP